MSFSPVLILLPRYRVDVYRIRSRFVEFSYNNRRTARRNRGEPDEFVENLPETTASSEKNVPASRKQNGKGVINGVGIDTVTSLSNIYDSIMILEFYALKSHNLILVAVMLVCKGRSEARELWVFQPVRSGTDVPGHVASYRRNGLGSVPSAN